MSSTEIYGVKTNGDIVYIDEASNAFAGAMHVWNKLCDKYGILGGLFGGFQELWKLADTGQLTDFENTVMKSTFDNVIVKKENISELIESFVRYDKYYPNSNLMEQVEIIESEILNNDDMIGVCWNQTSVNSSPWLEGYDEETDEEIPYNIFKGDKHWFL